MPYRSVRRISAGADGPWDGMLTWLETGERRVLVDAGVLGERWRGWDAAPEGHVLAPVDIARRRDGHDAVLPVCAERVREFLARRVDQAPIAPGEAVTLGVSVLRCCAELASHPDVTGEWWLTDSAKPVFATDAADTTAIDASADLLTALAAAMPHGAWEHARDAVTGARRSPGDLARAEDALFLIAPAAPLRVDAVGPRTARDLASFGEQRAYRDEPVVAAAPLWSGLVRHVDADLADVVSRTTTSLWRRARNSGARRRGMAWAVGGVAASVVLLGGFLWPAPGGGAATAEPPTVPWAPSEPAAEPSSTAPAKPETTVGAVSGSPAATDVASVAQSLLTMRQACGADTACLAALQLDPATPFGHGAIDLPPSELVVTTLDDFGGLAVVRVDVSDGSMGSQLVVIVRRNDEWLLRDVHDVAQQP